MTVKQIFPCNVEHPTKFEIKYSVAGEQKIYNVCQICSQLECFQKFIIEKKELRRGKTQ
jgi:hypothetical protein